MNRSHHKTSRQASATIGIATLMLAAGAAFATEGEHTDWPDFPDGRLLTLRFKPEPSPLLRVPREPKRRPFYSFEEHTDWPDFPDGDPSSFLHKLGELPSDPSVMPIGQIPSLNDLINPIDPTNGFNGFGATPNLGVDSIAPVPAPGGALLIFGLAAAATRRRR